MLGLHAQVVDALRDLLDAVELLLLLRPAGGQLVAVGFRVGQIALDRLPHVARLLAHRRELDLELAARVAFSASSSSSGEESISMRRREAAFVHEVDRLVGEEAV